MKIAVLNGSPKGAISVTMQYVRFLEKKFPRHEFNVLNVCEDIKRLENEADSFKRVMEAVRAADAVLWAFPVYVFLVPGNYKRFIELIFERSAHEAFKGKYAASLSTSVRFFDYTAHDYLRGISEDLEMRFFGSFSAAMYDLLKEEERRRLTLFANAFFDAAERGEPTAVQHQPLAPSDLVYLPGPSTMRLDSKGKKVVVLTDAQPRQTNLLRMIERFRGCFAEPPETINLNDISIRTGCVGCIQCSMDNVCAFRDSDDVFAVYQKIMAADILVFAAAIQDRYFSARWKLFWDRGFFHNHVPIFVGKQLGWLVSGPLAQLATLRQIMESGAELSQANFCGAITDECADGERLDRLIDGLARQLTACAEVGYINPPTFFGVSGVKIFRDEIWAGMRVVFQADHRYYKKHKLYSFPKRSIGLRVSDTVMTLLLKIPSFRKEFKRRMRTEMVKPLEKVVKQAELAD
jgi:multimeric flavodoxin WrbA